MMQMKPLIFHYLGHRASSLSLPMLTIMLLGLLDQTLIVILPLKNVSYS